MEISPGIEEEGGEVIEDGGEPDEEGSDEDDDDDEGEEGVDGEELGQVIPDLVDWRVREDSEWCSTARYRTHHMTLQLGFHYQILHTALEYIT